MKHRKERTEHKLREDLALFFDTVAEDDLLLEARVVRVVCSSDLRHAKVGLHHPRGRAVKERLLGSARALREQLRDYIGDRVSGRFVPDFSFFYDESDELLRTLAALDIPAAAEQVEPDGKAEAAAQPEPTPDPATTD